KDFWRQQEQKRQVRKSGFILFAFLSDHGLDCMTKKKPYNGTQRNPKER
ncbi:MAG: hypothetical protein ACI9G6_003027, partial [Limisphaerales bacterium]